MPIIFNQYRVFVQISIFSFKCPFKHCGGDLALQEAARILYDLPNRPMDKELRKMAEAWSPWRGVAARLMWAYYRHATNRAGISE